MDAASTPAGTTLVSPSGATTNRPTYTWNAVANASWYYLWVNDSTGNVIKRWYRHVEVNCTMGAGQCSTTHATTLANGAGVWWVRTYNAAGYGPWSSSTAFNVP